MLCNEIITLRHLKERAQLQIANRVINATLTQFFLAFFLASAVALAPLPMELMLLRLLMLSADICLSNATR